MGYIGALFIPISAFFLIVVFGALVGFIFVNISVIIEFYFKRNERKGKQLFGSLISPILGIMVCLYILIGMDPIGRMIGFGWLLLGVIILALKTKGFRKSLPSMKAELSEEL